MVSVRDIIIITIILLVIGIAITLVVYMSHIVTAQLKAVPIIANDSKAVEIIDSGDEAIDLSDYIYLCGFIAFFIAIIITGWFSSTHPVFSVIYFIIVILFTFIAVILQYAWNTLAASALFLSTLPHLPITFFILSHIAYFTAVMGLVGILFMFAKKENGGNYNV